LSHPRRSGKNDCPQRHAQNRIPLSHRRRVSIYVSSHRAGLTSKRSALRQQIHETPDSCKLLTEWAQSSGPENIPPERTLPGLLAPKPVNSLPCITLYTNGKIRQKPDGENSSIGYLAEQQSLGSDLLRPKVIDFICAECARRRLPRESPRPDAAPCSWNTFSARSGRVIKWLPIARPPDLTAA
jgi:hypothetical protein